MRVTKYFERSTRAAWLETNAGVVAAALLLYGEDANAYCRATSCDQSAGSCTRDAHQCLLEGVPLAWPLGTASVDVDSKASALNGISKEQFFRSVRDATTAWTGATCSDGRHPGLHLDAALTEGDAIGYESAGSNTNLVTFFDEGWPYEPTALGRTLLAFGVQSGDMFDADIALNSQDFGFSIDAGPGQVDLIAVLTHEIGHVLGLDHTDVAGATMQPETEGFATLDLRTLEPDDVEGICAIYPPETGSTGSTPERSGGGGGCTTAARADVNALDPTPVLATLVGGALALCRRTRKVRRQ